MATTQEKPETRTAEEVVEAICSSDALPTVPAVAMQVMVMCRDLDVDFDKLSSIVSADPSLAARILRIANSPAFRGRSRITSVRDALPRVGLRQTQALLLGFALSSELERETRDFFDTDHFWECALTTSYAAKMLADRVRPDFSDSAFAAGLVQDIGILALECVMPETYEAVLEEKDQLPGKELQDIERDQVGASHQQVGARLLQEWNLPHSIYRPVRYHHWLDAPLPDDVRLKDKKGARILAVADRASRVFNKPDTNINYESFHHFGRRIFGLSDEAMDRLLEKVQDAVRQTADTFQVDPDQMRSVEEIRAGAARSMIDCMQEMYADRKESRMRARAAAEAVAELQEENRKLCRDDLTGVLRRREFSQKLKNILDRAPQGHEKLALMFIDIDHFETVNDELGHAVGDEVLKALCEQMREHTRQEDLLGRYGGDEFMLCLPDLELDAAFNAAERLRESVTEASRGWFERLGAITVSIGIVHTCLEDEDVTLEKLFREADRCLYAAKREGRNCVRHNEL